MKSYKVIFFIFTLLILASGQSVFADPLVTCGNTKDTLCTACDLFKLAQNIMNFLFYKVAFLAATGALAYGGILLVLGSTSPKYIEKGKKIMQNTGLGIIIVFFSWFVIDLILKTMAGGAITPAWDKIECTALVAPPGDAQSLFTGRPGIPGTFGVRTPVIDADSAIQKAAQYQSIIDKYAQQTGLTKTQILALMAAESQVNTGVCSTSSCGLMQINITTAKGDSQFAGLSPADIANKLKTDQDANIRLGTTQFGGLLRKYGSEELALAAYNGGEAGALGQSVDCPGSYKFQCPKNIGGYQQTQDLIRRYNYYIQQLQAKGY